jgi:L-methionine (R)-S-oxide reductase
MHELKVTAGLDKPAAYGELKAQLAGLYLGERDGLANAANLAALLYHSLPDLNWAGFYLLRGDPGGALRDTELVLGPFQGKVACVRIPLGQGVCGTAAQRRETLIVPDVHTFPGHIACDAASRSEIVLPLLRNGRLWGVLDLDSPIPGRFDQDDAAGLAALVDVFLQNSDPLVA